MERYGFDRATGAMRRATRILIALTCDDDERRALAKGNLPGLLENPITVAKLERRVELLS